MEQIQMNKFCIDLDGVTLPDAIAAVVEAWYEAQNVENLIEQKNEPCQPGEIIEIKNWQTDEWEGGWVFFKAMKKKVGICSADQWNIDSRKPNWLVAGNPESCIFSSHNTGCKMRLPENIRRAYPERSIMGEC